LRLIDDGSVERLSAYVAGGGVLVLNYRAGTQNMDGSMRRMLAPGPFAAIAGVKTEAMLDLVENHLPKEMDAELGISFSGSEGVYRPRTILESLRLQGAETIAVFRGGRMAGQPAVTRNRHGKGWVYYAGTDSPDDGFYESVARMTAATAGLTPLIAAPYGVEVTSREDANTIYYFLLNLTETAHNNIRLPRPMHDLIAEHAEVATVSLGPLEVAVMASPRQAG
jgi:beta-galactosidase